MVSWGEFESERGVLTRGSGLDGRDDHLRITRQRDRERTRCDPQREEEKEGGKERNHVRNKSCSPLCTGV